MALIIQTTDSYYPLKEALQVNFGCSTVVRADLKEDGCGLESYWVLDISPLLTLAYHKNYLSSDSHIRKHYTAR